MNNGLREPDKNDDVGLPDVEESEWEERETFRFDYIKVEPYLTAGAILAIILSILLLACSTCHKGKCCHKRCGGLPAQCPNPDDDWDEEAIYELILEEQQSCPCSCHKRR